MTESAAQLDTTSAVVSGTLNTQTILICLSTAAISSSSLSLRPGVVQTPGGGLLTTATNGLPPQFNNYFIQGLDNNEPFTGQKHHQHYTALRRRGQPYARRCHSGA